LQASSLARSAFMRREYLPNVLARVARVAPAFGIGGVTNRCSIDISQ
jgi:hypothetical protein